MDDNMILGSTLVDKNGNRVEVADEKARAAIEALKNSGTQVTAWLRGTTETVTPAQVLEALNNDRIAAVEVETTDFGKILFTGFMSVMDGAMIIASKPATMYMEAQDRDMTAFTALAGAVDTGVWTHYITPLATFNDILMVGQDLERHEGAIDELRKGVTGLRTDVSTLNEEIAEIVFKPALFGNPMFYMTGSTAGMSKDNAVVLRFTFKDIVGWAKVKWQGSSSLSYPKKNYTITLYADEACTQPLAVELVDGWGARSKYNFKANHIDHSHARNLGCAKIWGQLVKSRTMPTTIYPKPNGGDFYNYYTYEDGVYTAPYHTGVYGTYCINGFTLPSTAHYKVAFDVYVPSGGANKKIIASLYDMTGTGKSHYGMTGDAEDTWQHMEIWGVPADHSGESYLSILSNDVAMSNLKFRNVVITNQTTNEVICLPPPAWQMKNLPNGGAVDGFPCVIMLNNEFHGLFTLNIPKDGWMLNMGYGERECILCANGNKVEDTFKSLATAFGDGHGFDLEYITDENDTGWALESLNQMLSAVINSDGSDLDTTVARYLDWNSVIDHYIQTVVTGAHDCTYKNYILHTYDGVKWFFTGYDMDSTFGLYWDGKSFVPANTDYPNFAKYATMHKAMELVMTYKKDALKARYTALRAGVLSEANVTNLLTNYMAGIPSQLLDEDARKWPTIPSASASNLAQMLNWYRLRVAVCDAEIAAL